MRMLLLIILAGGLGALSRYALAGLVQRAFADDFPGGTFAVNMLGCLLFGLVWGRFESAGALDSEARVIVLTGFLGAFTTFSTFAFESVELIKSGRLALAAVNVIGQNLLGAAALAAGLMLAGAIE